MHKTLYVDVDEEITSVIDRVRAEEATEIFLVMPKEAMLTQGVINLRLLKKEIDKIGKTMMIATNDANARKVIGRLGIKIKEMDGEIEKNEERPLQKAEQEANQEAKDEVISRKAAEEASDKMGDIAPKIKKQMDIGSDSFFDGASRTTPVETALPVRPAGPGTRGISGRRDGWGRGAAGQFQAGGSEQRTAPGRESSLSMLHPEDLKKDLYAKKGLEQRKISVSSGDVRKQDLFGNFEEDSNWIPTKSGLSFGKISNEKKAEKFFSKSNRSEKRREKIGEEARPGQRTENSPSKWRVVLFTLILVVGLGAGAMWAYANYPKVKIVVYPKKELLSKEVRIVAKEGVVSANLDEGVIPGQYVELTVEKSLEFDATGETFESDDGKAKGKVAIHNRYSSSPQPLVATTRVLSREGKLFRLVDSVTVPGLNGEEPGVIEADVIADEPGEDYNISASTFTIEGFKGNPKYEKFEVTSKSAMTDGGSPDSNKKLSMVTQRDLDEARKKTIDALEESLEQEVSSQISRDVRIVIDSVGKEIASAETSQKANEIAKKFTYTVTQKVKAIAFKNEDVNCLAMKELEKDISSGYVMDSISQAVFKKGISDFEEKTVTMYIDAEAIAWPPLTEESIIKGVVGEKEDEIRRFLDGYPEIEKVEITVTPSWLATVPASRDKIEVVEVK